MGEGEEEMEGQEGEGRVRGGRGRGERGEGKKAGGKGRKKGGISPPNKNPVYGPAQQHLYNGLAPPRPEDYSIFARKCTRPHGQRASTARLRDVHVSTGHTSGRTAEQRDGKGESIMTR